MKVLLINLGIRDIQIEAKDYNKIKELFEGFKEVPLERILLENKENENYLVFDKNLFLEITKYIYDNFDKFKPYLRYPIIESVIKKDDFDRIIFIATNQNDERYHKSDTFFEGKILENLIPNSEIFELKYSIIDGFEDNLKIIYKFLNGFERTDNLVFELSGGTPQVREMIYLLIPFFDNFEKIYLVKNNEAKDLLKSLRFPMQLSSKRDVLLKLIDSYDYPAVKEILSSFKENEDLKLLNQLLCLALDKLSFNYYSKPQPGPAEAYGKDYKKYVPEFFYSLDSKIVLENEYESLKRRIVKYMSKTLDLVDIIYIDYSQQRWQDFVAKVYRWCDAIGIYLVARIIVDRNLYSNKDVKRKLKDLLKSEEIHENETNVLEMVSKNLGIYEKLKNVKVGKETLKFKVSFEFFRHFFKELEAIHHYEGLDVFNSHAEKFSKLRTLRNKGINAHSFEPLGEYSFLNKGVKPEELVKLINEITRKLFGLESSHKNLFNEINIEFKRRLEVIIKNAFEN